MKKTLAENQEYATEIRRFSKDTTLTILNRALKEIEGIREVDREDSTIENDLRVCVAYLKRNL